MVPFNMFTRILICLFTSGWLSAFSRIPPFPPEERVCSLSLSLSLALSRFNCLQFERSANNNKRLSLALTNGAVSLPRTSSNAHYTHTYCIDLKVISFWHLSGICRVSLVFITKLTHSHTHTRTCTHTNNSVWVNGLTVFTTEYELNDHK